MNIIELMDKVPLWGVFVASLVIVLFSLELGFRMGRWRRQGLTGEDKIATGPFVATSLGLLAFMLAITFGAVASHFSERTHLVLDEANVISTAFSRTDLLPKADRAEIRQLLSDYVSLRVEALQVETWQQLKLRINRSEELQTELWTRAVNVIAQEPTLVTALFIHSMKDLIEVHTKRVNSAIYRRLPGMVWIVLYGVAMLAMMMGGYDVGASGSSRVIPIALGMALAFAGVIFLAIVLDRPLQNLSTVSQATMIDVQEKIRRSMKSEPSR